MAVDPTSLEPLGGDGSGARDQKTFDGPKPPADVGRLRDGNFGKGYDAQFVNVGAGPDPGYHPIPSRGTKWLDQPRAQYASGVATPDGEEYNKPFGRSDNDWDDAVTDQVR